MAITNKHGMMGQGPRAEGMVMPREEIMPRMHGTVLATGEGEREWRGAREEELNKKDGEQSEGRGGERN